MLANKQKIIPCARGVTAKARHKMSIYHKLEKTSMVIGVAGLLGGVIGPVIAPASEVLLLVVLKLNKVQPQKLLLIHKISLKRLAVK